MRVAIRKTLRAADQSGILWVDSGFPIICSEDGSLVKLAGTDRVGPCDDENDEEQHQPDDAADDDGSDAGGVDFDRQESGDQSGDGPDGDCFD